MKPQIEVPEVSVIKAVESGQVVNKKEEDPISSSKKEPKKEAEKEKPATSSEYDEKDPEAGAPEKTVNN